MNINLILPLSSAAYPLCMTLEKAKRLCCISGLLGGLLMLTGDYLFYGAFT